MKILINFSGIYLQLIINLLIIISLIFFPKNMLFNILFLTNSFSIIYALNPFFKNDGYWIFSDYFGIINLETKADKCFIQLFRGFVSPKKTFSFLKEKDILLNIFMVAMLILIIWKISLEVMVMRLLIKKSVIFI